MSASADTLNKPRVGIPWRTSQEESQHQMEKLRFYFDRVRDAGAEPVHISLSLPAADLQAQLHSLDGFVLPGSPADVDPSRYGATRHSKTVTIDENRDRTDLAILDYAVRAGKPVFAICYGCQILNVYFGGTLTQDLPSEKPSEVRHGKTDLAANSSTADLEHTACLTPGSHLAKLAGATHARINSSHHQAIDQPGKDLAVASVSEDGIVEAVEWTGDSNWILGAQWHPERMPDDPLARKLFEDFVSAVAVRSHSAVTQKD